MQCFHYLANKPGWLQCCCGWVLKVCHKVQGFLAGTACQMSFWINLFSLRGGKCGIKARTHTLEIKYTIPLGWSAAGIALGLWPHGILQHIKRVGYCVFYPTGIGSCYIMICIQTTQSLSSLILHKNQKMNTRQAIIWLLGKIRIYACMHPKLCEVMRFARASLHPHHFQGNICIKESEIWKVWFLQVSGYATLGQISPVLRFVPNTWRYYFR